MVRTLPLRQPIDVSAQFQAALASAQATAGGLQFPTSVDDVFHGVWAHVAVA